LEAGNVNEEPEYDEPISLTTTQRIAFVVGAILCFASVACAGWVEHDNGLFPWAIATFVAGTTIILAAAYLDRRFLDRRKL
jgi:hypothetical protein